MISFITSSPFREDVDRPTFSNANGFVDRIAESLPAYPRCVYICSSPERHDLNCLYAADMFMAFANAGIHFSSYRILDAMNAERAGELVGDSDLILLAGGHVPTQNAFFRQINLRELLTDYSGTVMGISAGSMNCADIVYAQPEEPGESDPDFPRFLSGLGLTQVNILPHFQKVKNDILDGKRLFEDITYPDSQGHTFYVLPDYSYIIDDGEEILLCGEAYRLRDGILEMMTRNEETMRIRSC